MPSIQALTIRAKPPAKIADKVFSQGEASLKRGKLSMTDIVNAFFPRLIALGEGIFI